MTIEKLSYNHFNHDRFLQSLQNPPTLSQFFMNIETLIHNGEYSYSNSLSLFQNVFPRAKTAKGVRYTIIQKYKEEALAETIYDLLTSSKKIDCSFLQKIDEIIYPYI